MASFRRDLMQFDLMQFDLMQRAAPFWPYRKAALVDDDYSKRLRLVLIPNLTAPLWRCSKCREADARAAAARLDDLEARHPTLMVAA